MLLYRRGPAGLELLVAHPGGPLWARRDEGAWSLIKGEIEAGETPVEVCRREFREETGAEPPAGELIELGEVRQRAGKVVVGFAAEGDLDPGRIRSATVRLEWPPRSGRAVEFPEIDRVAWLPPDAARRRLNPAQAAFVDRLLALLAPSDAPSGGPG